jgi:hypothetical protein
VYQQEIRKTQPGKNPIKLETDSETAKKRNYTSFEKTEQ